MTKRQMKIGLSMRYHGYHDAGWRHPEVPADGSTDYRYYANSAQIAERGLIDFIFFADGVAIRHDDNPKGALSRNSHNVEIEPITLLAAIAPLTSRIGLVTTASTTYNEPYHIARKFATLDHISGGRAGWNAVTSWSDKEAWNFSRAKHLEHATRYERADEFLDVVTGLWDSWDDDAFLHDKISGQFYDPAKLHTLNHQGKHFQVMGPLSNARTPQGRPIITQAGASGPGMALGAKYADLVYAAFGDLPTTQSYYAELKAQVAAQGRDPDSLLVMPAITAVIGRTRAEAQAKTDELGALIDPLVGLSNLYRQFGDLSAHGIDDPVPEPVNAPVKSLAYNTWERARAKGMTIRDLFMEKAFGSSGINITGTAEDVADIMEEWMEAGAADGFILTPTHLPHGVADFVDLVVPELQRRGRFRTAYEGPTVRENLGLPPAVSRYAAAGS